MYPSSKLHSGGDLLQQTRLLSLPQDKSGLEGGFCVKAGFSMVAEHCYENNKKYPFVKNNVNLCHPVISHLFSHASVTSNALTFISFIWRSCNFWNTTYFSIGTIKFGRSSILDLKRIVVKVITRILISTLLQTKRINSIILQEIVVELTYI